MRLKEYERELQIIIKKINKINEELVEILNQIENEYLFDPFSPDKDTEVNELWEKVSKARNYEIY